MKSFKFPTRQQEIIWQKRRQEVSPSVIARELEVSRALVSKAQRIAEERIEQILRHTASTNRMSIRHMSTRYGFAVGYCPANKSDTYIVYSPSLGTQLWFNHGGDCENCSEKPVCEKTLHILAEEWNVPLQKNLPATEAGEDLFNAIMRRLKWIE
ncbi:MAG: hypothetical protein ACTSV2_04925 [Candidatus Thorarchaeota archaeon]